VPGLGLRHLDRFEQLHAQQPPSRIRDMTGIHEWLLERDGYWSTEIPRLRSQLEADKALSGD